MPELPRGLRIAATWLDQIRAATGVEPDQATIDRVAGRAFWDRPCIDCGVPVGTPHTAGCDVAVCQEHGEQRLGCSEDHDCGLDVWDGVMPDVEEAVEYGFFGYWEWEEPGSGDLLGGPWVECGPEHPSALPARHVVRDRTVWDSRRHRNILVDVAAARFIADLNTGTMGHVPDVIELWQPSPLDARFAPDAWDEQVGQPILITLPGPPPSTVTRVLRAAVVEPGGAGVRLTLDAKDEDE